MIIYDIEQNSEAWFQARCGRITGTRFKSLMAGDSTKAFQDLILDIVIELATEQPDESYSNFAMERGKETEPDARKMYESEFDVEIKEAGFIVPDEDNEFHHIVGVSPDGLTTDNGMIEIKCPMAKTHLNYILKNTLPAEYKHQVQGQLFVTGLNYCDFVSYYPNMKPFIIRVYPDQDLFKQYENELNKLIPIVNEKKELYNKYFAF